MFSNDERDWEQKRFRGWSDQKDLQDGIGEG